jgi:hypothetical protein
MTRRSCAGREPVSAVLAGLAVVALVGLATPLVLGGVTAAVWSRSAGFDVGGLARGGLFILVAVAWIAWLRILVGLCLDVAHGLQLNRPGFPGDSKPWKGWSHARTELIIEAVSP